ncbi:MAG: T9SS type A sorting domain-containing protein [Melioribacteraceae bacterium]|nr:T9SS type A sorting domain-containing protein [Melioribacteraceae bacterium]MCF8354248.1 T9SS type A sorting domain-containing protein [Melioribacteraceae bacterium]MCF8394812.1 T9SS type A sorting domain-containing protein [Melioribacteraceae bacterium]MCF8417979.1 T9SS type A sorting domain-containing protein [Melioribacteraceae bacterium]
MLTLSQNINLKTTLLFFMLMLFTTHTSFAQYSGEALAFSVTGDPEYATGTGISTSISNLTLEAWVFLLGTTADPQRFVTIGGEAAVLRVINNDYLEFFITTGGTPKNLIFANVLNSRQWYHVAGTWDGTTMKLFLDGEEVASSTPGGILDSPDGNVMLSHDGDGGNESLYGLIEEVRFWDAARTEEQIKNNMFTELVGSETGLSNYWKLNGNGNDEKGSADLTLYNGPVWQFSGAFYGPKRALQFDGTDDHVNCGNDNSLDLTSALSIEAWVKPVSGSSIKTIVSKKASGAGNPGYSFYINSFETTDQKLVFETQNAILKTDNAVITWGEWHHVAVTTDGTTTKIYVNGKEEPSTGSVNLSSTSENCTIGSFPDGNTYNLSGAIDEVRIWSDVRTGDEIRNNFCNVLRGNETDLAGYWRFDQAADTHAPDQTGTNHGTLNNMTNEDWISADEFNTWTGQNSGNTWQSNDLNWSLNRMPTSSDNVCIPNLENIFVNSANAVCNNLAVHSGRTLYIFSGYTLSVAGNLWVVGSLSTSGSNPYLKFTGGSKTHSIYVSSLDYVELDDVNGAELVSNLTVNNDLKITSGDLDLNGNILTLGGSATFSETAGNTVTGSSGYIQTTRNLNAPSSENVAGLGAIITSSADLGSTNIKRGHAAQSGNSNSSINRYYDISPSNNSELNATLIFCYDDSETSGFTEDNLCLFRSDDGSTWTQEGGSCNSTTNQIELSGIDAFSMWTASDDSSPLPVELTYFEGNATEDGVLLEWKTATEVNNYGFEVERTLNPRLSFGHPLPGGKKKGWVKIGFVEGYGNSNSPKDYSFTNPLNPNPNLTLTHASSLMYRLKQIDTDGSFEYSDIVEVTLNNELPAKFELFQNYPNPFNPTTTIKYTIPALTRPSDTLSPREREGVRVSLTIYNTLGQQVATLIKRELAPGEHKVTFNAQNLSSGVYFYRLTVGDFTDIKKLSVIK